MKYCPRLSFERGCLIGFFLAVLTDCGTGTEVGRAEGTGGADANVGEGATAGRSSDVGGSAGSDAKASGGSPQGGAGGTQQAGTAGSAPTGGAVGAGGSNTTGGFNGGGAGGQVAGGAGGVTLPGKRVFVGVGYQARRSSTVDGKTWKNASLWPGATDGDTYYLLRGGCFGKGRFLAVGGIGVDDPTQNDGFILTSTDGERWTEIHQKPAQMGGFDDCAFGNGRFVAGDKWSVDGVTWTSAKTPVDNVRRLAFGNGVFVAGGDSYSVSYSTDGDTWIRVPLGGKFAGGSQGLSFASGRFVAVGTNCFNGNSYPCAVTESTDGKIWSNPISTFAASPGIDVMDVGWGAGRWVIGGYGDVAVRVDGQSTWTSKLQSPGGPIAGYSTLVFTPKRFSTDGLNWIDSGAPGHNDLVKIVEGAL